MHVLVLTGPLLSRNRRCGDPPSRLRANGVKNAQRDSPRRGESEPKIRGRARCAAAALHVSEGCTKHDLRHVQPRSAAAARDAASHTRWHQRRQAACRVSGTAADMHLA
jgi:hypothetical protein